MINLFAQLPKKSMLMYKKNVVREITKIKIVYYKHKNNFL